MPVDAIQDEYFSDVKDDTITKLAGSFRFLRILKLVRIAKMTKYIDRYLQMLSEFFNTDEAVIKLAGFLIGLVALVHVFSCV